MNHTRGEADGNVMMPRVRIQLDHLHVFGGLPAEESLFCLGAEVIQGGDGDLHTRAGVTGLERQSRDDFSVSSVDAGRRATMPSRLPSSVGALGQHRQHGQEERAQEYDHR